MILPHNKQSAIEHVMSLTPVGMRDGRDNVLALMEVLGNPQNTLRVFHIAGSNGKGSVCQMLSQVLWKRCSKKVGLFTSPHFVDINERFQINGKPIADTELEKLYERVLRLSKKHDIPLTFFEIQVAAMVLWFTQEKVDYAVVEVGLGGTYDGTNIFAHPLACFVTSIAQEHSHVLGKSRPSILRNKLGIVKKGTHLYTPMKHQLIRKTCDTLGATLHTVQMPRIRLTNLPGNHQDRNAQMVLEALRDRGYDASTIKKGLQEITNPGRFEWLSPTLLVDTANNIENIKILAKMVKKATRGKEITVLYGTTQVDPAYAAELAGMIEGQHRILVDDFCDRSLPCSDYAEEVPHESVLHLLHEPEKARALLEDTSTTKVVYGSFYLLGEIMKMSRHKPFAKG